MKRVKKTKKRSSHRARASSISSLEEARQKLAGMSMNPNENKKLYRKAKKPTLDKILSLLFNVTEKAENLIVLKPRAQDNKPPVSSERIKELQDLIEDANYACGRLILFAYKHPEVTKFIGTFEKSWVLKVSVKKGGKSCPDHAEIDKKFKLLNIGTRLPSVYFNDPNPKKDTDRAWKMPTMYAQALFDAFKNVLFREGLDGLSQEDFQTNWKTIDSELLKKIVLDDALEYVAQPDKPGSANARLRSNIGRSLESLLRESGVLK